MALWFCNQIEIFSHQPSHAWFSPYAQSRCLDVLAGETHLLAQAAGQADDEHLGGGHAESGDWREKSISERGEK